MDEKQANRRGLLRIIVFILLFSMMVVKLSYIARPHLLFTESYNELREEEAPIDVLFLGGSSTLVFWSPMLAFDRYGISSYNFSDSAMAPSLMSGLIEESMSYCSPKLYVLDLRGFENWESHPETFSEGFFRNYTDVLPYSWNRMKLIHYASQFADFAYSPQALYADLIYYHGEWRTWNNVNWERKYINLQKGQFMPDNYPHRVVTLNAYPEVTDRRPLSEKIVTILHDLLDYIEERNLPVLFLLNAYAFPNEEVRATYNSLFDILEERGIPYLDTNLYYEEMGLNGKTDFYDVNHVNAIGAEKYTDWLARWLIEQYGLADHRDDPQFQSWKEELPQFHEKLENAKQHYWNLIKEEEQTHGQ